MSKKMQRGESVMRTSADLTEESMARLQEIFPECFTDGRVDFDKLRATLGEEVDSRPERYSFTWAGKRDAIRLLQTPSRATLIPCASESVNFDETNNLFIEGDNLEVLKLLYKSYFGRVKMIYIDPPYNTGNDFIYPDNFADPLDTYLRLTSQKDGDGNFLTSNPETSGRYHSAWLSMLYPRFFLARQLLCEDGVIVVSIDDHEVYNLRLLMNEVFGEDNFVALIVAQTNPRGRTLDRFLAKTHEYLMVFARDASQQALYQVPKSDRALAQYNKQDGRGHYRELELRNRNPVFNRSNRPNLFFSIYADSQTGHVALENKGPFSVEILPLNSKGEEGCWTWGRNKVRENLDRIVARQVGTGAWRIYRKDYLPEEGATTKEKALWLDKSINHENGKEELGRLFGNSPFDFPKSVELIKKCVLLGTRADDGDLILDFLAGSCTTAQAVVELNREDGGNRRFIMVQLPEPTPEGSEARKQGYKTIAEIGKERIRRVIQKMKKESASKLDLKTRDTPEDLGFKVFKLAESNYKPWAGVEEKDSDEYAKTMELYTDPLVPNWKPVNVVWEVVIKEGYGLNSHIEPIAGVKGNAVYRVTDPDKAQSYRICLDDTLKPTTLKALNLGKDDLFICRDKALDDEAAANLALQCRLKTI